MARQRILINNAGVAYGEQEGPPSSISPEGTSYACSASKTLLNTLTGAFAVELSGTPVKVNSVCPGFNATDLNGNTGTQHPSEDARVVVRAATLPPDGPTGSFFDATGAVGW